jgi:hypothetical protein
MLSNLPISPLSKALKWLVWVISAALFLLICSIASFNYMESKAEAVRLEEWERIENDTLPGEILKESTTVAKLIATPEKYHNQSVWVKGYLNLEFEGDAIYWREVDYQNNNFRNAYRVQFADSLLQVKRVSDYSKHYVIIKGVFDVTRGGHLNPGSITEITSLNGLQSSVR